MKKLFSLLLCAVILSGTVLTGALSAGAVEGLTKGEIIEYGSYPQTDVTASLGSVLNETEAEWISYNYYRGTGKQDGLMEPDDLMFYRDVEYDGIKYRGVKIETERPDNTFGIPKTFVTNQRKNGYLMGQTYWFRFDPIRWRVLDADRGLLFSDIILDSQPLNNYILWKDLNENGEKDEDECFGNAECTYYANNFKESSLRKWLNEDFYNTAFSSAQKAGILETENDHKERHVNYVQYACENTVDNVFLLSIAESINSDYGFVDVGISNKTRYCTGTDYAKAQGLYVSTSEMYSGNSEWLLRNPDTTSYFTSNIGHDGSIGILNSTFDIYYGVRPCIRITGIDAIDSSYREQGYYKVTWDAEVSVSSAYYKEGETIVKPSDPVKSGYAFNGWTPVIPSVMPAQDLVFTAKYEKTDIIPGASVRAGSGEVYKNSVVTVTASCSNVPEGYTLVLYDGDKEVAKGSNSSVSYTIPGEVSSDRTFTARVVDAAGKVQKDSNGNELSGTVIVKVKTGFFNNLIAFFRKLFRMNKVTI